jgi:hypothetical protein
MPNYDAGHYFLTVLAPIRAGSVLNGDQSQSHKHMIKETLALLPNAERTIASLGNAPGSPFSRTKMTHFARFVVLDDVVFNGRTTCDTLVDAIRGVNPLIPQKVDRLSTPFLIFAADFDADSGDDSALRKYTATLWASMAPELTDIFRHCEGFDGTKTADDFHRYITRCQIDTTMPFNDYWSTPAGLTDFSLTPYKTPAIIAAGVAGLGLLGIVLGLIGALAGAGGRLTSISVWLFVLGLLVVGGIVAVGLYSLLAQARRPFPKSPPPGPASDLPTVLKALQTQRAFTAFAIERQGLDDQAIYDAFGAFLASAMPNDVDTATQPPGVIGI